MARHQIESWGHCFASSQCCSLDQRGAHDVQREEAKSDHQESGEEKLGMALVAPSEELRESPCPKSHFLGGSKHQGEEEQPAEEES